MTSVTQHLVGLEVERTDPSALVSDASAEKRTGVSVLHLLNKARPVSLGLPAFTGGVNHGLLPREPYAAAARDTWAALVAFVQPDGKLTHVQRVGYTPVTFDECHPKPYGVVPVLLAGGEMPRRTP